MTKLLLRLFVRAGDRASVGRLSGIVGVVCNLLLAAVKLMLGILSGSVAITADALNNLTDATSSVVTYIGFKLSERPADREHPYGHARYEYISALVVSGIILIIGFELGKSSFEKILSPAPTDVSAVVLMVLAASIGVKLWMFLFNRTLSKQAESKALWATAIDCRNDCIATTAVVISAAVEYFTSLPVDGYIGLLVSVFIFYSGVKLARETISPLLGEAAGPETRALIVDYISQHPKVLGYHDLYVHDYGPGQRFASIHVEMSSKEDPLQCHEIIDDMERECFSSHGIQLVIHYDPIVTDDPELDRVHALVDQILHEMDERISTHDFRMVRGEGHTNLIFDIVLPESICNRQAAVRRHLEEALAREDTTYYVVITFDSEAFNPNP